VGLFIKERTGIFFLKGECLKGEVTAWKDKIDELDRKIS